LQILRVCVIYKTVMKSLQIKDRNYLQHGIHSQTLELNYIFNYGACYIGQNIKKE